MNTLSMPQDLHWLLTCRKLFIRRHEVMVNMGAHDFEKHAPQRVWIDVDLYVPYDSSTPRHDALHEVVDYDYVREAVARLTTGRHITLQETLADALATELLKHPQVFAVRLSTSKPDVYPDCETVGVEVFRLNTRTPT
ncbi:MAG: dihydroneopterin aldolase [Pseudomonadota bacterium]